VPRAAAEANAMRIGIYFTAAAIAFSMAGTAEAAVDIINGPRQFNLECIARPLYGGIPPRQVTAIDLDRKIGWHVERNIGSNLNRDPFPLGVEKGSIDLGARYHEEKNNTVKRSGLWLYQGEGLTIFGVCKIQPFTPIPTKAGE